MPVRNPVEAIKLTVELPTISAAIVRHGCSGGHTGGGPSDDGGASQAWQIRPPVRVPVLAGSRPDGGYLDAGGPLPSPPGTGPDPPGPGWPAYDPPAPRPPS